MSSVLEREETKDETVRGDDSMNRGNLVLGGLRDLSASPVWWKEGAEAAWKTFQDLPMPKRKDEDWRFANIQALDLGKYAHAVDFTEAEEQQALTSAAVAFKTSASAVFLNDEEVSMSPLSEELKSKGVLFESLQSAFEKHPELIRKHFMSRESELGSEKFAALHRALCRAGAVLFVPKGVEIADPIVVTHFVSGENSAVFPHTLIVAEDNCKVTFMDYFRSLDGKAAFACSVNDLVLSPGAKVDYAGVQLWSEESVSLQLGSTAVEKDASSKVLNVNIGGGYARVEAHSRLVGPGARSEMLALSVVHGKQEFDQRTLQDHQAPHTWSDLLFKNTLNHRSKTIFEGLIKVEHGAKQTDAYQNNRNLLLHPDAEADSMPGLEIANDDVKCTHGATTGQISEEELFYMLARGITPGMARHLIAMGFYEEILERFGHDELSESLRVLIEEKFRRSAKISIESLKSDAIDETDVRSLQGTE